MQDDIHTRRRKAEGMGHDLGPEEDPTSGYEIANPDKRVSDNN